MADFGTALYRAVFDVSQMQKGAASAAASLRGLQAESKGIGSKISGAFQQVGGALSGVGRQLTREVTLPLVAVGVLSIRAAADFQAAMLRIQTQAGATAADVARLTPQVEKLAGQVGFGPSSLAEALFHVVSAGIPAARQMEVLRTAAEGARVGNADLTDVTNTLVAAIMTHIKGAEDSAHAMGILNAIVGSGNLTFQELATAMGTGVLSAAQTFGVSLDSVGAALAVLTDRGIPAQRAARELRVSFSLLAAPTVQASKILQALGLTADDAGKRASAMSQLLKKAGVTTTQLALDLQKPNGMVVALQHLRDNMVKGGVSAEQANAAISRAFGGGQQSTAIITLLQNLDAGRQKFDQINRQSNKFGSDFAATTQTTTFRLHQFRARLSELAIQIGNVLLPMANRVVAVLGRWIQRFSDLSPHARRMVVIIGLLAAAAGPLLVVLGTLITAIGVVGEVLLGPVGLALLAIIGLVILVRANWSKLQPIFERIWPILKKVADIVLHNLVVAFKNLVPFLKLLGIILGVVLAGALVGIIGGLIALSFVLRGVAAFLGSFANVIFRVGGLLFRFFTQTLPRAIGTAIRFLEGVGGAIFDAMSAVGRVISRVWAVVSRDVMGAVRAIGRFLERAWNDIAKVAGAAWRGFVRVIRDVWNVVVAIVRPPLIVIMSILRFAWRFIWAITVTLWNAIVATIAGVWRLVRMIVEREINGVINIVRTVWGFLFPIISAGVTAVWNVIQAVWGFIRPFVEALWNGIVTVVTTVWNVVSTVVGAGVRFVWNLIQTVWGGITGFVSAVWNGIVSIISGVWGGIKAAVGAGVGFIRDTIGGVLNWLSSTWGTVWGGLVGGVEAAMNAVIGAAEAGVNFVIDVINGLIGALQSILNALPGKAAKLPTIGHVHFGRVGGGGKKAAEGAAGGSGRTKGAFHSGGLVGGTGEVTAKLEGGEFIVRKEAVARLGHDMLERINAAGNPANRGVGDNLIGTIGHDIGSGISGVAHGVGKVASAIGDVASTVVQKGAQAAFMPIRSAWETGVAAVTGVIGGDLGTTIRDIADSPVKFIDDWLHNRDKETQASAAKGGDVHGLLPSAIHLLASVLAAVPGTRMSSGYRSPSANKEAGGSATSLHMQGKAEDFVGNLGAIFGYLRSNYNALGLQELIYQHTIVKRGVPGTYGASDHFDHVHAGVFSMGGIAPREMVGLLHPEEMVLPKGLANVISDLPSLLSGGTGRPPVHIEQTFNEKADPLLISTDIAWRLDH